jgi:hypothetical protein
MNQHNGVDFFWEIINKKPGENFKIIKDQEEFKILENNKIIELKKDKWLTHKDDLLHFLNIEKKILLSPSHFDIVTYDILFGGLIGNDVAYNLIDKKLFDICEQQIHEKDKTSELDNIIYELKDGVYGKIKESNFWFIDIYPYIVSNTFFFRDIIAIKRAKAKSVEYDDNFGGRCVSLLSLNKILIQEVPIYESTLKFEEERLGTKNLEIIMGDNGIRRNECLSKKLKNLRQYLIGS